MNVSATAKFVGTSSRKIGLVAAIIRGRKVAEAVTLLNNTPKRATGPVGKVLKSAIANAENNFNLKPGSLVIESVLVGPGPTLKRFRPRAQGRAFSIRKRSSHITVILSDGVAVTAKPTVDKSATPKAAPASKAKTTAVNPADATKKEAK